MTITLMAVSESPMSWHVTTVTPGSIHTVRGPCFHQRAQLIRDGAMLLCVHVPRPRRSSNSPLWLRPGVLHARCVPNLRVCEECRVPIGDVDDTVFSRCNVRGCGAPGAVVCARCGSELEERLEAHLARMGKLSGKSATGWLASFGSLENADKTAVVRAAYDVVLAAAQDDFRVVVEPDGGVVHFTRRLHEMSRGTLRGPVAYETLAAFDPSLPRRAAAAALRRFVAEMRRYWQEVPRTREVMPIGDRSRVRAADGLEEARTLVDPAVLVGRSPAHAAMLAELRAAGTLHMLGREVFYFKTSVAPVSARQSRRRVAEWQALFQKTRS